MRKSNTRKGRFSVPVGALLSWKRTPFGASITAENAEVEVIFYSPRIARVRVSQPGSESGHSYAVVSQPMEGEISIKETDQALSISSHTLTVRLSKSPLRISYWDAEGNLLNEEDEALGTSWIGYEVSTYRKLQDGERFIGLGEKTGNLDRRGSAYVHWNTDNFGYPADSDPLYLSTPFYIGLHSGRCYGLFLNNSFKSTFNFEASNHRFSSITAEDGDMDTYFFHDATVAGILEAYTWLTGRMPLPPKWALGYHQCRYSYYPDSEVLTLARTFREKGIPADVIYLDIHYMDAYKVFTFHPQRFPDPKAMTAELEKMGFHLAVILDPGVKTEKGYAAYDEGMEKGYFAQYPDGQVWEADVWPGRSAFPDFTDAEVREWWANHCRFYVENGVTGFWNDMNEPACWGQTVPDLVEFEYEGDGATHKRARNVWGMQMARSTYAGAQKAMGGKRPFVLTRAGFSGVQRYSAVWTGDNTATDEHMLLSARLVSSLGLAGVAFSGPDVGGFAGQSSPALMARWMALGAFTPFFRGHSMVNSHDAEPWSFGEEVEEINRNFIRLRYRLLPYMYSAFYESTQTGMPVARALPIYWPFDPMVYDHRFQNQFLFGSSILVAPVESGQRMEKVYLPEGVWYDFYSGQKIAGGQVIIAETPVEKIPVYVRAGAILPIQSQVFSMNEKPADTLNLHVFAGGDGDLEWYDDDGETYGFEQGQYCKRKITLRDGKLEIAAADGAFLSPFTQIRLHFHHFEGLKQVMVDGKGLDLAVESVSFLEPISAFDPWGKGRSYGEHAGVGTVMVPLGAGAVSVMWGIAR